MKKVTEELEKKQKKRLRWKETLTASKSAVTGSRLILCAADAYPRERLMSVE